MADAKQTTGESSKGLQRASKIALWGVAGGLGLLLLLAICFRIYLASGLAAPLLSKLVTANLHQAFSVEKVQLSEGSLVLKRVRLQSPPGFPARPLVAAESVSIAPGWIDLLRGRQRFGRIALVGVAVNLDKNGSGAWNYAELQRQLAARKPSPKETVIEQLVISNGSLRVQGAGVQGVSLQIFNLTTKGSLDSKLDLDFQDPAGNRFQVKGKARAGSDAALDLAITAPALSLKESAAFLKLKNPERFQGGTGTLAVNVSLHKGALSCQGDLGFRGLKLPLRVNYPVAGTLHFAADYDGKTDTARLQKATLAVEKLVKLHAEGEARGLKRERAFTLLVGMDDFALDTLNVLLPDQLRKGMLVGGRLRCEGFRLEGAAGKGLSGASGVLQLADVSLAKGTKLLVAGLSGEIGFSRSNSAIVGKGKLAVAATHDKALLQALELTMAATLSPQLKPLTAEVPAFSARAMDIPFSGRLGFDASRQNPLSALLRMPSLKVATVNEQLRRFGVEASAGTCSISLALTGKGARDLSGSAELQLAGLRGSMGKKSLSLASASITAKGARRGERIEGSGNARLQEALFDEQGTNARFAFRVADDTIHLDEVRAELLPSSSAAAATKKGESAPAVTEIALSHLAARLPPKGSSARSPSGFPLTVDVEGGSVKKRELTVENLSGRMRGSYHADGGGKWLEGNAQLAAGGVSWQGKPVGKPALQASLSKSATRAQLGGELLGGKLTGSSSFDPFSPATAATFDVALAGVEVAAVPFLPKGDGLRPSEGRLDLQLAGNYSSRGGLSCRFAGKGSGVGFTGAGGKKALSGAGVVLAGGLAGGNLSVREAVVSLGPGVALTMKGELAQALTAQRSGTLSFTLPSTAVNGIIEPLVNMLPRRVQEATIDGTIGADGKVTFKEGRKLVEGSLAVKGGQYTVQAQKLVVADINGKIPFSLDLSRKEGKPDQSMDFSKENFWRHLGQLRKATGGETFSIGRIALGAIEMGSMTIKLKAESGVTQFTSLKTTLFDGELLGKGYLTIGDKVVYRGDLMIHNLSLTKLCSTFPNIAGYISGRIDGVVSLGGHGSGLKDVTGYLELWAREKRGEKMVVSKEFLQRLAKQKLAGFFFSANRPYDRAEIRALLQEGFLTFDTLVIEHTNFLGVRDLRVAIAPEQNRIAFDHLLDSIREAAVRGKPKATAGPQPAETPAAPAESAAPAAPAAPATPEAPATEFKWGD